MALTPDMQAKLDAAKAKIGGGDTTAAKPAKPAAAAKPAKPAKAKPAPAETASDGEGIGAALAQLAAELTEAENAFAAAVTAEAEAAAKVEAAKASMREALA